MQTLSLHLTDRSSAGLVNWLGGLAAKCSQAVASRRDSDQSDDGLLHDMDIAEFDIPSIMNFGGSATWTPTAAEYRMAGRDEA